MKQESLKTPLSKLKLSLRRSKPWPWILEGYKELRSAGLSFRPPVWIGDEWFSPSNFPGVAIPFYLCSEKLLVIQRKYLYIAEGASRVEFLKILRHEFGHAYETAFRLSRRKRWRELFGNPQKPYPKSYRPDPFSDKFVHNIRYWYAQAHPHEDFAETFAVCLRPDFDWRRRYRRQSKVLEKLEYVNELISELRGRRPKIVTPKVLEGDIRRDTRTLFDYLQHEQHQVGPYAASNLDEGLLRLFGSTTVSRDAKGSKASEFLRKNKVTLRSKIAVWTGAHPYMLDHILEDMIQRCRELSLFTVRSSDELWDDTLVFLTSQIMLYLGHRNYRISL